MRVKEAYLKNLKGAFIRHQRQSGQVYKLLRINSFEWGSEDNKPEK
jgi:hypothetical protein